MSTAKPKCTEVQGCSVPSVHRAWTLRKDGPAVYKPDTSAQPPLGPGFGKGARLREGGPFGLKTARLRWVREPHPGRLGKGAVGVVRVFQTPRALPSCLGVCSPPPLP